MIEIIKKLESKEFVIEAYCRKSNTFLLGAPNLRIKVQSSQFLAINMDSPMRIGESCICTLVRPRTQGAKIYAIFIDFYNLAGGMGTVLIETSIEAGLQIKELSLDS